MFREKSTTSRRDFKSGLNANSQRTKRAENAVTLRKNDRDEQLARRRRVVDNDGDSSEPLGHDIDAIPAIVASLSSNNMETVYNSAKIIRQLLSLERSPPIDNVINSGGVPLLINLLKSNVHNIVFEASWALTNIASGTSENTTAVVNANAVPVFIDLLASENDDVRDQAVWALGNISGECCSYRDLVLSYDAMPKVMAIAHSQVKLCMLRNIAWTMSNFCRGKKPLPNFSIVSEALPTLYNMIFFEDDDVIADACWALSYLSDDDGKDGYPENYKIDCIIQAGVVPRLVQLLSHPSQHVKVPALRAVGNLVTGNEAQTDHVLSYNVIKPLISLLQSPRRSMRKEACWTISNIAAGTVSQTRQLLVHNIFHSLLSMIPASDMSIRKEIGWSIANSLSSLDREIVEHLISIGVLPHLCEFLRATDAHINSIALDACEHILKYAKRFNYVDGDKDYHRMFEEVGIVDAIEELQKSGNQDVYQRAYNIATEYFEFEQCDSMDGPETDGQGNYDFNVGDDNAYNF